MRQTTLCAPFVLTVGAIALAVGAGGGCGDSPADSPSGLRDGATPDEGGGGDAGRDGPSSDADPDATTLPLDNVITYPGTGLGQMGVSVNGRIQPHGAPTDYYFEFGPTTAYGKKTPVTALGPKLAAYYSESYQTGLGGWRGGAGADLTHEDAGFARFTEPSGNDLNHIDGVGILHLVEYFYPGTFAEDAPTAAFGGADPDLRDAKVKVVLRGNAWQPVGTELVWWSQIDPKHGIYAPTDFQIKESNWAHTGYFLTDHLFSGQWETAEYRLWNDTTDWTYSGTNRALSAELNRDLYVYTSLNDVLTHLDTDFFHVLLDVNNDVNPVGTIDFQSIEIAYRNHSLVFPSNGGKLASSPAGSPDSAATLTDGWRVGAGKTWRSAPSPSAPLEFVYDFAQPVVVNKVQLHQNVDFPSKDVEVLVSNDDGTTWTTIVQDVLPESHPAGPNFVYLLKPLASLAEADLAAPAKKLKVRILSGYRPGAWGLGEIEVFGTGAQLQTDDEYNRVNADITGLTAGETVHYRLVAVSNGKTDAGKDLTYTVPVDTKPYAVTGAASRIASGKAHLEARINTLGEESVVLFEYGTSPTYGTTTVAKRAGPEITIRTAFENLTGLTPGSTVHYRVVVQGSGGTTRGADSTFVAK